MKKIVVAKIANDATPRAASEPRLPSPCHRVPAEALAFLAGLVEDPAADLCPSSSPVASVRPALGAHGTLALDVHDRDDPQSSLPFVLVPREGGRFHVRKDL